MKNKRIIALIAGVLCIAILSVALVWSLSKPKEETTPEDPVVETTGGEEGGTGETGDDETGNTGSGSSGTGSGSIGSSGTGSSGSGDDETGDDETGDDETGNTGTGSSGTGSGSTGSSGTGSSGTGSGSSGSTGTGSSGTLNPDPTTKEEIEAVLNDPFMILVNRDHKVSDDYVGSDLVTYSGDYKLNSTCAAALRKLIAAGKKAGYSYTLYSGYRSYSSQYNKYYNKIAYWEEQGYSYDEAVSLTNEYYAPPGASEHHTGLAADVCIPEIVNKYACLHENYDQTEEFEWFSTHAHEYGFILRYPEGAESITGYSYEPWHYRYVGVEIAGEIYERGITLEEYVADLEARLSALE